MCISLKLTRRSNLIQFRYHQWHDKGNFLRTRAHSHREFCTRDMSKLPYRSLLGPWQEWHRISSCIFVRVDSDFMKFLLHELWIISYDRRLYWNVYFDSDLHPPTIFFLRLGFLGSGCFAPSSISMFEKWSSYTFLRKTMALNFIASNADCSYVLLNEILRKLTFSVTTKNSSSVRFFNSIAYILWARSLSIIFI